MAESCEILMGDKSVPLPYRIDLEVASAINCPHVHQKVLAHSAMMNEQRNRKGAVTAIIS